MVVARVCGCVQANSTLPTAVDPVKEILDTRGFSHSSLPMGPALPRALVTTFSTPGGRPACSASCKQMCTQYILTNVERIHPLQYRENISLRIQGEYMLSNVERIHL